MKKLEKLTRNDARSYRIAINKTIVTWEDYQKFVIRIDSWYAINEKKYLRYMSLYGREFLSEVEFKLAFRDLATPFNEMEIELIYETLDPKLTGMVDYTKLYEAIWIGLAGKYVNEDNPELMDLDRPDKWIMMTFKVPSCEPFDMPTTFDHLVEVSYTGNMLREIIQSHVPIVPSRHLVLFTDISRYAQTTIGCHQKLSDFNYEGGPKCAPQEGTVYYEFSQGRIDCPLVKLDYSKSQKQEFVLPAIEAKNSTGSGDMQL